MNEEWKRRNPLMGPLKGWSKKKVRKRTMEEKSKQTQTQTGLINELLANVRAENERLREACNAFKGVLAIVLARMGEVRDMAGGDPEGIRLECQKAIDEVKAALLKQHLEGNGEKKDG